MNSPLGKIIDNRIFRTPSPRQSKAPDNPASIPTLKGYTAHLVDVRWLRLRARRKK